MNEKLRILLWVCSLLFVSNAIFVGALALDITSVTPSAGTIGERVAFDLGGTDLLSTDNVTFIDSNSTSTHISDKSVIGSTNITGNLTLVPGTATGTGTFMVSREGVSDNITFVVHAAPYITGVTPSSGTIGETVAFVITGTGFLSGDNVTFVTSNSSLVSIPDRSVIDSTHINGNFTLSPGIATGAGTLKVSRGDVISGNYTFTVHAAPHITGVTPSGGTVGERVGLNITGTGFLSGDNVTFVTSNSSSIPVLDRVVVDSRNITGNLTLVPGTAVGAGVIRVGRGMISDNHTFTVYPPPVITGIIPDNGMIGENIEYEMAGTGFLSGDNVTLVDSNSTSIPVSKNIVGSTRITGNFTLAPGTALGPALFTVRRGEVSDNFTFMINAYSSTHNVSVSSDSLGWIDPSGRIMVQSGQNLTFTVHPYNGAEIKNLTVDDVERSLTPNLTFTLVGITRDYQVQLNCQSLQNVVIGSFNATYTDDPMTVQFNDTSMARPPANSWKWNFGDSNLSTSPNPEHTYATPGSYLVGFWVRNNMTQSYVEGIISVPRPVHAGSGIFTEKFIQSGYSQEK